VLIRGSRLGNAPPSERRKENKCGRRFVRFERRENRKVERIKEKRMDMSGDEIFFNKNKGTGTKASRHDFQIRERLSEGGTLWGGNLSNSIENEDSAKDRACPHRSHASAPYRRRRKRLITRGKIQIAASAHYLGASIERTRKKGKQSPTGRSFARCAVWRRKEGKDLSVEREIFQWAIER